jgi:hypothetical protein
MPDLELAADATMGGEPSFGVKGRSNELRKTSAVCAPANFVD